MNKIKYLVVLTTMIILNNSCSSEKDIYYHDLSSKLENVKKGMSYYEVVEIINRDVIVKKLKYISIQKIQVLQ